MKTLLKLVAIFACFFLSMLLIGNLLGWMTVEQIEAWLEAGKKISPWFVGSIVVVLLWVDLFIAVPTLSLSLLSGFFLGFGNGFAFTLIGLCSTGASGYFLSRRFGEKLLGVVVKEESKRREMNEAFVAYRFPMILLARAMPMLPEMTACLAGMNRMPFSKFMFAWLLSAVPYAAVTNYAGSISSLGDPMPALLTAIGISGTLLLGWYIFSKKIRRPKVT